MPMTIARTINTIISLIIFAMAIKNNKDINNDTILMVVVLYIHKQESVQTCVCIYIHPYLDKKRNTILFIM